MDSASFHPEGPGAQEDQEGQESQEVVLECEWETEVLEESHLHRCYRRHRHLLEVSSTGLLDQRLHEGP